MLRTVSIIPGIENFAPERTDTSGGSSRRGSRPCRPAGPSGPCCRSRSRGRAGPSLASWSRILRRVVINEFSPEGGTASTGADLARRGLRHSGQVEAVPVALAAEAHPLVVGRDHPGRGEHLPEPAVAEQARPPEDELPGAEVTKPRGDVVELDLRHAFALVAHDHDTGRLVAVLHEVGGASRGGPGGELAEQPVDVGAVD